MIKYIVDRLIGAGALLACLVLFYSSLAVLLFQPTDGWNILASVVLMAMASMCFSGLSKFCGD